MTSQTPIPASSQPPAAPQTPPYYGQPQPLPPKKKHTTRNVVFIVIGAVIVLSVIGAITGSGDSDTASPATTASATDPGTTASAASVLEPSAYPTISGNEFSHMMTHPDSFKGEEARLYGIVIQADNGDGAILANMADAWSASGPGYYDKLAYLDVAGLSNPTAFKVGAEFVADVTSWGTETYTTQIGTANTVPELLVNAMATRSDPTAGTSEGPLPED